MHATLHSMIQSKGADNSPLISSKYEDYLQEVVRLFKEILKSHEKSFLVKVQAIIVDSYNCAFHMQLAKVCGFRVLLRLLMCFSLQSLPLSMAAALL